MTAIVSAIDIASSWSCVTWTNVMPTSCWMRLSSICSCLRRRRSSAPSGSSSSSARGPVDERAGERDALLLAAGQLRRACACRGRRAATSSSASPTRVRTSSLATLLRSSPKATFSRRQVREQRVGLEDRVDVALVRRQLGDVVAAEEDAAVGRAPRSRRSSAASSSCRSPTGRAARRTRRAAISRSSASTAVMSPKRFVTRSRRMSGSVAHPAGTLQNGHSRSPSWTTL